MGMAAPEDRLPASSREVAAAAREWDFAHAASHELRTPLTVIRVAGDLLAQDTALSEASQRSLARIQVAAEAMETILDALLLLARSEHCALEYVTFPVAELVAQEVERIRPLLQAKHLRLQISEAATPVLHAPRRVLQVMLGNVLDNAVRFTDSGEVRIRIESDRVQVEDTGIGMDDQTLQRACAPFYCARDGEHGGPGLGLSVAHRLGQRCGWLLLLESDPSRGTRASIVFAPAHRD